MKHPVTGERATALTPAMVQALSDLQQCQPAPHFIPNINTALAMLRRGWVKPVIASEPMNPKTLYFITHAGRTALRIGARHA